MQWEASAEVPCPYCGESTHANVDLSQGDSEYIEDCQVCCRPILFTLTVQDLEHGMFAIEASAAS